MAKLIWLKWEKYDHQYVDGVGEDPRVYEGQSELPDSHPLAKRAMERMMASTGLLYRWRHQIGAQDVFAHKDELHIPVGNKLDYYVVVDIPEPEYSI